MSLLRVRYSECLYPCASLLCRPCLFTGRISPRAYQVGLVVYIQPGDLGSGYEHVGKSLPTYPSWFANAHVFSLSKRIIPHYWQSHRTDTKRFIWQRWNMLFFPTQIRTQWQLRPRVMIRCKITSSIGKCLIAHHVFVATINTWR